MVIIEDTEINKIWRPSFESSHNICVHATLILMQKMDHHYHSVWEQFHKIHRILESTGREICP